MGTDAAGQREQLAGVRRDADDHVATIVDVELLEGLADLGDDLVDGVLDIGDELGDERARSGARAGIDRRARRSPAPRSSAVGWVAAT